MEEKDKYKLKKIQEKYKIHENLIIAREARKTIRFIEKNCDINKKKTRIDNIRME